MQCLATVAWNWWLLKLQLLVETCKSSLVRVLFNLQKHGAHYAIIMVMMIDDWWWWWWWWWLWWWLMVVMMMMIDESEDDDDDDDDDDGDNNKNINIKNKQKNAGLSLSWYNITHALK